MPDNKHPCNIGPSYQPNDRTGECEEGIEETISVE
jgi:hypothetical protein